MLLEGLDNVLLEIRKHRGYLELRASWKTAWEKQHMERFELLNMCKEGSFGYVAETQLKLE